MMSSFLRIRPMKRRSSIRLANYEIMKLSEPNQEQMFSWSLMMLLLSCLSPIFCELAPSLNAFLDFKEKRWWTTIVIYRVRERMGHQYLRLTSIINSVSKQNQSYFTTRITRITSREAYSLFCVGGRKWSISEDWFLNHVHNGFVFESNFDRSENLVKMKRDNNQGKNRQNFASE